MPFKITYRRPLRTHALSTRPASRRHVTQVTTLIVISSLVAACLAILAPAPQEARAAGFTLGTGWSKRGIPQKGQTLVGAVVQDQAATTAMEVKYGTKLGVRRTYWNSSQVASSVAHAKFDLDNGRLPWMSYKVPQTWSKMASGAGDAWAKDLANQLATLPGPVWVAFVHEPENDSQSAADWRKMQIRLSPIMRAKPNIGFTTILMGWHQFLANNGNGAVGKTMADYWPGTQYVDVAGFDPYNWYGTKKNDGSTNTAWDELKKYYDKFQAFSQTHGDVAWAVAETGYTHTAATKDASWLTRTYDDMKARGGAALSYFDVDPSYTGENSSWTWPLSTTLKQTAYRGILKRTSRLTISS